MPTAGRESTRRRADIGKILMSTISLVLTPYYMSRAAVEIFGSSRHWVAGVTFCLLALYYAVIAAAYLRRAPAAATSPVWTARAAAVVATWLPLVAPFIATRRDHGLAVWIGNVVLIAGLCWCVWALSTLGRNLSVIPQARALATSGPYRFVRHPLYLGELTMLAGILAAGFDTSLVALYCTMLLLQLYRIHHEELLLCRTLPQYLTYRTAVKRLVPHVY